MSLRVTVYAGALPYIDVGIPDGAEFEALSLRGSTLTFAGAARPIKLEKWKPREALPVATGLQAHFVLVAPAGFSEPLPIGSQAELTLYAGANAPLTGSGPVVGPDGQGEDGSAERWRMLELYSAYPILTSPGPDGAAGGGAPASGGDARAVVQREWRNVLGRVPREGDVAGMLAALDRRFVQTEADGAEGWAFTPGSYVGQNDVGAGVTGAQASLAAFAGRVSDEIGPYVAEATALRLRPDNPEELDVARNGLTASWGSFTASLGGEGGVPAARSRVLLGQVYDQLLRFGIELGTFEQHVLDRFQKDSSQAGVTGAMALARLVVTRKFVLTRDDEERLTNFMIVRDRVAAVGRAFDDALGEETRTLDYGMAFAWLQRDLDVLPELVADVRWALDSVDFGLEQQEALSLDDSDVNAMTLAGVLQWAEDLADEGRTLMQDSGVRGARLLAQRATELGRNLALVYEAGGPQRDGTFGDRLRMSRISVPIRLLNGAVEQVQVGAERIDQEARDAAREGRRG
jgi:hypothetical protein